MIFFQVLLVEMKCLLINARRRLTIVRRRLVIPSRYLFYLTIRLRLCPALRSMTRPRGWVPALTVEPSRR